MDMNMDTDMDTDTGNGHGYSEILMDLGHGEKTSSVRISEVSISISFITVIRLSGHED